MKLRTYQQASVEAVYDHLRTRKDNPLVVLPTGAGKSLVMAAICRDAVQKWNGRVLILAHVKELLQQTCDKLMAICPEVQFGVFSAGLRRRDTEHQVIVAGIQSVFKRACELGPFNIVLVDEAHLIPPKGEGSYRRFLSDALVVNPRLRVVGLTATSFRTKTGSICSADSILNHVCFEVSITDLIREGYLCPLVTKQSATTVETGSLHVRGGEFVAGEVEQLMQQDGLVESACQEIIDQTLDRKSVLIFASGVQHGRHITEVLKSRHGVECGFVIGDTANRERRETLERFTSGDLKYLCNVGVLTTGFDSPRTDCVAIVRPTMSPGLYCQMVGRGFRIHESKKDCLVLDFGGNVKRHGPVDQLVVKEPSTKTAPAPLKECPECGASVFAGLHVCPHCSYQFPPPEQSRHESEATSEGILSGQVTTQQYDVHDAECQVYLKRGGDQNDPRSLRVEYRIGLAQFATEYIAFERSGYARHKAIAWWRCRSREPVPKTSQAALDVINRIGIAETTEITLMKVAGRKYDQITAYRLGTIPGLDSNRPSSHLSKPQV